MNAHARRVLAESSTRGIAGLALLWMVTIAEGQFVTNQSTAIVINDNSTATPYPSVIDLTQAALPGLIQRVSVTISGLTTPFTPDFGLLLVGPNSNAVVLLSGSGANPAGNSGLTAAQLTFRDDAPAGAPVNSPLISGSSYKPSDNAILAFPSPAQTTNYSQSLSTAFAATTANGLWRLYALDTTPGPPASFTSSIVSWELELFLGPAISSISTVHLVSEAGTQVHCTVTDADGVVTNVTATVHASPVFATISTSLEGTNVTLTIWPGPVPYFEPGTNAVEVVATDDNGFKATNYFTLEVQGYPQPYFFFPIPRQTIRAGTILGPIAFTVLDAGFPFFTGTVRANSSDQKSLPDSNILVQQTGVGGYTLTAFPVGGISGSGSVNITIVANDGVATGTTTFNVLIQEIPLFVSPETITIEPNAPAIPYPATISVSGLIGHVEHVTVTLFGMNSQAPGNTMILLDGPSGTNVLLMAGAGGENGVTNTTLVFSDYATNTLPQSAQIISGMYRPASYSQSIGLPSPAPSSGYGGDFSAFKGTNPNGDWKLYVYDNGSAKVGLIANGWQLSIQTAPKIPPIKDQVTPENTTARLTITVGDNQPGVPLTVTATGSADLFQLPIAVTGSNATRILSIVPQPYKFGTNTITVTATDPDGATASAQFQMGVQFVPQPPLFISVPPSLTACPYDFEPIFLAVWSPQGSPLALTASSPDNPTLVLSVDIIPMAGTGKDTNLYWLIPKVFSLLPGTATILISVSDTNGLKSSASFKLTVPPECGFFAVTNSISIPPGATNDVLQEGEATPYPSAIKVVGLEGVVKSVKVILIGLTHPHPEDLKVLLVSPDNSRATILMAHAGSGNPANDVRLSFVDGLPAVPHYGPLADETYYSPADYSTGASLPLPAPPAPYGTNLAVFKGMSPNGDWKLFVLDDTYPDGGSIGGWLLRLHLNFPATLLIQQNGNGLAVSFTGPTNTVYGIQTSADLATWTDIGTVTIGTNGAGKFDVQIDPATQARFYRVVGQ